MAKVNKLRRGSDSQALRMSRYPLKVLKGVHSKKKSHKAVEKKDWEDATCSVCMEFPHNAVLLLCSSYNKGCRPYMCATGHRYSNCLEQYKKAYTKVCSIQSPQPWSGSMDSLGLNLTEGERNEKTELPELLCPLCRGQVKGWTVVERARKYLNAKKRTCMQDNCSFAGSYKELRKHVKSKHPLARPRAVDPLLQEKWKRLECERERSDVISTIMSSTPRAVIVGDYVLEPNNGGIYSDSDSDSDLDDYMDDLRLGSFDFGIIPRSRYQRDYDSLDEDDFSHAAASNSAAAPRRNYRRGYIRVRRAGRVRGQAHRGNREAGRFL